MRLSEAMALYLKTTEGKRSQASKSSSQHDSSTRRIVGDCGKTVLSGKCLLRVVCVRVLMLMPDLSVIPRATSGHERECK